EVFRRAAEQGAFIFWNHPGWQGPEKGRWGEVQTALYEKKWLHGIEIANGETYYEEAHAYALEKNLTLIGTSDIHDPDLRKKNTAADHRTCTLVFAKEKSLSAVEEALRAGRTLVWFKNQLIGREEWLRPMFEASVQVLPPHHRAKNAVFVHIRNRSEVDIRLERTGGPGPAQLLLPAGTVNLLRLPTADPTKPIQLEYTALNFLLAPKKPLSVILTVPGKE
ncbi:MAG: Sb-PDE family phosphodiesterase, partial [Thermoguttaceae bacterium]|nr:Sb-PDE family phosphodiesterase [Thermoguttaceae bacterium]